MYDRKRKKEREQDNVLIFHPTILYLSIYYLSILQTSVTNNKTDFNKDVFSPIFFFFLSLKNGVKMDIS